MYAEVVSLLSNLIDPSERLLWGHSHEENPATAGRIGILLTHHI
jgi:hypothetical protein